MLKISQTELNEDALEKLFRNLDRDNSGRSHRSLKTKLPLTTSLGGLSIDELYVFMEHNKPLSPAPTSNANASSIAGELLSFQQGLYETENKLRVACVDDNHPIIIPPAGSSARKPRQRLAAAVIKPAPTTSHSKPTSQAEGNAQPIVDQAAASEAKEEQPSEVTNPFLRESPRQSLNQRTTSIRPYRR